jgi:hypothetical protein
MKRNDSKKKKKRRRAPHQPDVQLRVWGGGNPDERLGETGSVFKSHCQNLTKSNKYEVRGTCLTTIFQHLGSN